MNFTALCESLHGGHKRIHWPALMALHHLELPEPEPDVVQGGPVPAQSFKGIFFCLVAMGFLTCNRALSQGFCSLPFLQRWQVAAACAIGEQYCWKSSYNNKV